MSRLSNMRARDVLHAYRRMTLTRKMATFLLCFIVFVLLLRAYDPSGGLPIPSSEHLHPHKKPSRPLKITKDERLWKERSEIVKEAFHHAYTDYEKFAFGKDELKPLSNGSQNNLNGWGLTIVDSLDTMLLMGLDKEFERGMEFVKGLKFNGDTSRIPFFETIIRYLGGFLSAYYLALQSHVPLHRDTYAPILLKKANELGEVLITAFNTKSGLPVTGLRVQDGSVVLLNPHGETYLAEMASCQMEFKYLAHLTKEAVYFNKSDKVMDLMQEQQGQTPARAMVKENGTMVEKIMNDQNTGLWTIRWYVEDGKMYGNTISAGAMGDSAYEYLLKQYLLSGRTEKRLLNMYLDAMDGIINNMMYLSTRRNLLYVTDLGQWASPSGNMDHLSCYLPGVLALGAKLLNPDYPWPDSNPPSRIRPRAPIPSKDLKAKLDLHMRAAIGLAHTCWVSYEEMETGIGPEIMHFNAPAREDGGLTRDQYESVKWGPKVAEWEKKGRSGPLVGTEGWPASGGRHDWDARDQRYLLRPEAVEAMYLLWKTTGDNIWRERGWKMFEAINTHTRNSVGYTSISYVNALEPHKVNDMPSFYLAETLKYAYLNTLEKDLLPLDRNVFNTEAHPFPAFAWTPQQIKDWGIH
ncbi:hypothetical protein FRC15_003175 [Serendipita sp. 397]|nr:hypothetical protein FRC15_003175 [Serendipita sp. 397]